MSMHLRHQAAEILGKSERVILTERVDDVALLIGQMVKRGLPEVLDRHLSRHWKQRGLRWGWTAVMWLASLLTEGDHRKVSVEAYIKGMKHTERMVRTNDRGQEVRAAEGDECERTCCAQGGAEAWTERVVVRRSPRHTTQQAAGVETRLGHAEKTRAALTPPRGRGTRQITDEATRLEAIDEGRNAHRVSGLLSRAWEKQIERKTQYVGRGRGSASRGKQGIATVRSPITRIARQGDTIAALTQRFGWKAFVTNAGHTRRSLQEAVLCSRNAYRVERLGNRLKSRVHIAPLFVKRNEQIEGLTSLLTLGVRVLTVMECVLRRSLENDQVTLPGLHPENKKKMADKPTAERILEAFADVSLTIITHAAGEEILRRLTPLSGWQEDILQRQGFGHFSLRAA